MNSDIPKQHLKIHGKPIIQYTIERFLTAIEDLFIVVAMPKAHRSYWEVLPASLRDKVHTVDSGETRFHSVKNALDAIPEDIALIAVHDAVRPMVSTQTIEKGYETAQLHQTAIPVMPITASLRRVTKNGSQHENRAEYREVQTPQVFNGQLLRSSYKTDHEAWMTDDASVVEAKGFDITLYDGNRENIKITFPSDIQFAKAILNP